MLVHCQAGISRSPTIVIAYLMNKMQMRMNDAYNMVRDKRPIIAPNLVFMSQLMDYEVKLSSEQQQQQQQQQHPQTSAAHVLTKQQVMHTESEPSPSFKSNVRFTTSTSPVPFSITSTSTAAAANTYNNKSNNNEINDQSSSPSLSLAGGHLSTIELSSSLAAATSDLLNVANQTVTCN